jgi:hypothetical protein
MKFKIILIVNFKKVINLSLSFVDLQFGKIYFFTLNNFKLKFFHHIEVKLKNSFIFQNRRILTTSPHSSSFSY